MMNSSGAALIVTGLVLIVIGLVFCFAGWHFFRLSLILGGAFVGAQIGTALAAGRTDLSFMVVAAGVIGAVLGLFLAFPLFRLATMVYGAFAGYVIANAVAAALHAQGNVSWLMLAAGAILGALIAPTMRRYLIMLSTAFIGAAILATGAAALIPSTHILRAELNLARAELPSPWNLIITVAGVTLAIVGFASQVNAYRHAGERTLL